MTIYLPRSALIQPRTSLGKSDPVASRFLQECEVRNARSVGDSFEGAGDGKSQPLVLTDMPPGTAEDDRVLPKTKNPDFLENYFTIFRNPPTPLLRMR